MTINSNKVRLVLGLISVASMPVSLALLPPLTKSPSKTAVKAAARTVLHYRDSVEDADSVYNALNSQQLQPASEGLEAPKTGVQMGVIRTLAMSQTFALAGATTLAAAAMTLTGHPLDFNSIHWNDSEHFRPLFDLVSNNGWRFVEGFLAAIPVIYAGNQVETSDERDLSQVNFSTMNMVMTLFGRRAHESTGAETEMTDSANIRPETPMIHALLFSTAIALLTGVSEEIIFRGMVPAAVFHQTESVIVALLFQAVLFGVGHQSPQASRGENNVVGKMQTASGLWYGLVYLLAGGDILPCIIAHAVYDLHIFMETWMHINDQMDYTEDAVLKRLTKADETEIRKIKQEAGPSLSVETLAFLRRFFYAFDRDRVGRLSKSDVQRAVTYAFQQDASQPSANRVDGLFQKLIAHREEASTKVRGEQEDRLRLSEFLRMILFLRANPSKVPA